jgi:hypothetical protein
MKGKVMAVEIKETCSCGAEFYIKDTVIFGNSAMDRYREFLAAHKVCREAEAMRLK